MSDDDQVTARLRREYDEHVRQLDNSEDAALLRSLKRERRWAAFRRAVRLYLLVVGFISLGLAVGRAGQHRWGAAAQDLAAGVVLLVGRRFVERG